MFGIGVTEMIVIGLVILMLFSPRELPGMMKTLARAYGSIRRTAEEFRAQVMDAEELREPIEEIRAAYHGTKTELLSAQELARRELGRARAEAMKAQQKLSELHREESRREVAAIKGRVSTSDASDSSDASAIAASTPPAATSTPPAPVLASAPTHSVPSSAPVHGSSAPVHGSSAPVHGSSAPVSSSAAVPAVPAPPAVPTPAPPPPFIPPPATDRSDAA